MKYTKQNNKNPNLRINTKKKIYSKNKKSETFTCYNDKEYRSAGWYNFSHEIAAFDLTLDLETWFGLPFTKAEKTFEPDLFSFARNSVSK